MMKTICTLLVALSFTACAETRIYRDGALACVIQGDATNVTFKSGDVYFHADILNHSTATGAAYTGVGEVVGATATSIIGAATVLK